ncbi:hypothetical protein [Embleya hyalina]|uniref:Uncharacterized protein n=1 Tax=Embleya hyalina TaxID=516124 RepID=A0A401Z6E8_9ACTN|nr:hypothetical protein [Embleya hyalina]GCE02427.1 hypothetical protein EHYA_10204 [Embleya hyalina]
MLVVYELCAEYAESVGGGGDAGDGSATRPAPIKLWHMIRNAGTDALCGRALLPHAETRSDLEWGSIHPVCHTCGALYLRQVP